MDQRTVETTRGRSDAGFVGVSPTIDQRTLVTPYGPTYFGRELVADAEPSPNNWKLAADPEIRR
jgi:hypothetical protein